MCRIAGFASLDELSQRHERLDSMLKVVAHGGPDDVGTYIDGQVALGHRRLSIIDLSAAGHQPMALDDDLIITYNGEIYNYLELKRELDVEDVVKTQSDTEIILQAYRRWGTAAFDRFEGIFAFVLYDKQKKKIFLVRDHLGVKPLYYYLSDKLMVFGSEVRVFREFDQGWRQNENWKILFLAFGSIPHPCTTLEDVFQLQAGYFIQIDTTDFSNRVSKYSRLDEVIGSTDDIDLVKVRNRVQEAIKKNLISDAPLGVFLSGGIDSSLVTLLADQFKQDIKTLSINFEEAIFDESAYQTKVLEKTKSARHTICRVDETMFWESLPDIWNAMDQPTIDGVNTYFVSKCAHLEGLKAVLSGLGADEMFGGYASFKRIKWIKRLRKLPFKRAIAKMLSLINSSYARLGYLELAGPVGDYLFLRGIHIPGTIAALLNTNENNVWRVLKEMRVDWRAADDDRTYASQLEVKFYMTNQLLKDTDCMSMWHALEVRVPFLDITLLRLAESIPPAQKHNDSAPKYLLTKPFADLLPREIVFRLKKGF
ncbi:MAG TPA: asparagine synthase (glutamine-hydrolyzing), partial [Cyclobacteriaceae bacterium]|nr:asparagine synthase (glutamine-hydrolyzing) [Cyclobacteriaceae bacterium]